MDADGPDRVRFSPRAMHAARVFARLTFADLSRGVGVSRQYLQKLEAGERQPSPALLAALADVLEVQPRFLVRPFATEVDVRCAHFRRLASTSKRDLGSAAQTAGMLAHLIRHLSRYLEFPRLQLPVQSVHAADDIERAAADTRVALEVGHDAPIQNIVRAVERAGVFVTDLESASAKIDAFTVRQHPPIIVRSTLKGSTSRARMDVGHELGHLVLHDTALPGDRTQETEATKFGAALLLPRAALVREFPASDRWIWSDLFRLKARWGVSVQAILMRAQDCELIDPARVQTMFAYMSKKGWRRGPEPEEPPPEEPELLVVAFRELYRSRGLRPVDVFSELGWTSAFAQRVLGARVCARLQQIGGGIVINIADRLAMRDPAARPRRPTDR